MKHLGILLSLLLAFTVPATTQAAATEPAVAEPAKGPHGGRLLEKDGFAIEISIFESGVPPEMRVFAYQGDKPLAPSAVQLTVTLNRLDGEQNQLSFSPEQDYLLGNATIVEPHSYQVQVEARHDGKTYQWQYDSFEGRVTLNDRMFKLSGISTERAEPRLITQTVHLFGVIAAEPGKVYSVASPFPAQVQQVMVQRGDKVVAGQVLAQLMNTTTLKTFSVKAPAAGLVTRRLANPGQITGQNELFELADYSTVTVELSAFPDAIGQLKIGQQVTVADLHQQRQAQSQLQFIAPEMTEGHIARVRAVLDNADGQWRPGMHITADVIVAEHQAALAVRKDAIQSFRDMAVVFARYGNTFEVRMLETGLEDDVYVEVLGGLKAGTEYATQNSYLLKADVEKDGASHDH
jgi:cobalt-zinc-cadmium efflux system membrane fusion protein